MKWSEFKNYVEKELNGEDPEIFYIDVKYPDLNHEMSTPNINIIKKEELTIYCH